MPEPANLGTPLGYWTMAAATTTNSQPQYYNDGAANALVQRLNAVQADLLAGINGLKGRVEMARRSPISTNPNAHSNFLMSDMDEISLRIDMAAILAGRLKELPATLQMPAQPDFTISLLDSRLRRAIDALKATAMAIWNQRKAAAAAQAQKAAANRAAIQQRLHRG